MSDQPDARQPEPAKSIPERAAEIFDASLELAGAERDAFIAKAYKNDVALEARVRSLLQAHDEAGTFLDAPASAAPSPNKTIVVTVPLTEKPGDRIGRYKLLQQLGEGGCGVVYMAEQEEPVRRRVALKVIKLGMDTKSVIARFEAERQALAMMDHPNIAKVLDAGATETGRPYFVMELVRGIRITEYCDQNKLSTEERLDLFIQVCRAIQHAHQKGIIHRDIKPSNILVTLHDGQPVPKVIDFGIAKATQGRLTDQTLFTAFEQFIGTPAYMSPEQAEMSGLDVDTRSDIYALGVLLYELLTGRTPFDARELLQSGLDELRRTIREKEPERPSTRLSTMMAADLTAVAQRRKADAPKLIHLLKGDLDWIVMKALEKDRTRRYETANGLGMDVQRLLRNEPVEARPASKLYRFQKAVRRNKTVFAALGAGMAALILGLALSLYLFVQEKKAFQRAQAAEREQARLRERAEKVAALEAEKRASAQISEIIGMSALALTQGKFEEAEKGINQIDAFRLDALAMHPAIAAIFNILGEQHGRHGEWRAAITNFARVAQAVPSDDMAYHSLAALYLQNGDVEAYQRHRERMLQLFGGTSDPAVARRMAQACLLLPLANNTNFALIGRLAELAVASGPKDASAAQNQFVKGLADYRLGRFASAHDWFQQSLEKGDRYHYLKCLIGKAMAEYQLKRVAEASTNLNEGLDYANHKLPKPPEDYLGETWREWIAARLLLHEAQALVGNPEQAARLTQSDQQLDEATALRERATAAARKGQWKEASSEMSKLLALTPDAEWLWFELGAVLLAGGDLPGYEKHIQATLDRYGDTSDPGIARRVAKSCLLRPASGATLTSATVLAERSLAQDNDWREIVKALADYRAGQFGSAVEWAQKALARPAIERRDAEALLVLAMAERRQKHGDAAAAALAKATALIDKFPKMNSGELGPYWIDVATCDLWLREAQSPLPHE